MALPFYILLAEPFEGFMPEDMIQWLEQHPQDADLADAMAIVSSHIGNLAITLDEIKDHWMDYAFDQWQEVEERLYREIIRRMAYSNQLGLTQYDLNKRGWHYIIKPFMEAHGGW